MGMFRAAIGVSVVLLAIGCSSGAPHKVSPDFKLSSQPEAVITVMPVTFYYEDASGSSRTFDEIKSVTIERRLERCMEVLVVESRYELSRLDVGHYALKVDPALKTMMENQWDEIDRVFEELEFASEESLHVEYTAGAEFFGEYTGSDYLLFVGGSGWHESMLSHMIGEAMGAAITGLVGKLFGSDDDDDDDEEEEGYVYVEPEPQDPLSDLNLQAFLVDTSTEMVVWYSSTSGDRDPGKSDMLLKSCKDLTFSLLGKSELEWEALLDVDLTPWFKEKLRERNPINENSLPDSTF